MTKYKVLREFETSEGLAAAYALLDTYEAHDADSAIAAAVKALSDEERAEAAGATYVAVPLRSWTEATPEVQLELKVKVR